MRKALTWAQKICLAVIYFIVVLIIFSFAKWVISFFNTSED